MNEENDRERRDDAMEVENQEVREIKKEEVKVVLRKMKRGRQ